MTVATAGSGPDGVYYTSDGGSTWDKASGMPDIEAVYYLTAAPGERPEAAESAVAALVVPSEPCAIPRERGRRVGAGRTPPHAQPRAARLAGRLRRGGRLAARRGGLGRRRGPFRADRPGPGERAAVLLPAADRRFIAERVGALARLPSYPAAVQGMAALPRPARLPAVARSPHPRPGPPSRPTPRCRRSRPPSGRSRPTSRFDQDRFETAYAELEESAYGNRTLSVVLAAVEGLVPGERRGRRSAPAGPSGSSSTFGSSE